MKENYNYNNIGMPCWTCPHGHNCKYYSDSVWDQWILEHGECPAVKYAFNSIYEAIKEKEIEKRSYHSPLKS